MSNIQAGDILTTLNLAGQVYLQARASYNSARELAAKAGVSAEDLAAADERFAKVYADPLATTEQG